MMPLEQLLAENHRLALRVWRNDLPGLRIRSPQQSRPQPINTAQLTVKQRQVAADLIANLPTAEISRRHNLSIRCIHSLRTAMRKRVGENVLPRKPQGRLPSQAPTQRESVVLALAARGKSQGEISKELHISRGRVCTLLGNAKKRLARHGSMNVPLEIHA